MNAAKIFSYGAIPRKCDRARAYLYFKGWAFRLFEFEGARREEDVIRVVLLASLNNGYVGVNRELVNRMRKLGALSKPLT